MLKKSSDPTREKKLLTLFLEKLHMTYFWDYKDMNLGIGSQQIIKGLFWFMKFWWQVGHLQLLFKWLSWSLRKYSQRGGISPGRIPSHCWNGIPLFPPYDVVSVQWAANRWVAVSDRNADLERSHSREQISNSCFLVSSEMRSAMHV